RATQVEKKPVRHIPQSAERVLDAPELLDDYYLNLLDWSASAQPVRISCTNSTVFADNVLAIALGQSVYLWNATTSSIEQLMQTTEPDNFITSGTHLLAVLAFFLLTSCQWPGPVTGTISLSVLTMQM